MKRTFYPSAILLKRFTFFFFAFVLLFGVTVKAQTFSIWTPADVPATELNDAQPSVGIEVGFKFKVTQLGTIKAIRFYKYSGSSNGSFRVNLWTNAGANLSTALNASVTGAGWMEIDIPDVVLTPGNVYVISVFSPTGYYSVTNNYFPTNADQTIPPFIIVANGTDPAGVGNGVYRYTAASAFPNASGNSSNYWIDLVFTTTFTLPVTLSDFRATTAGSNVSLNWKTDHEYNNRGFEIQRSNNGADWYAVNFVNSTGDGTTTRNYNFTDKGLAPGTYYYRLMQSDLDGKNTYSAIATATISGKGKVSLFQNYPNPFSGSTKIRFDLPETQHARLTLIDLSGREVKVLTDKLSEAGSHVITLDATNLRPQVYLVTLRTANGVLTKKISVK